MSKHLPNDGWQTGPQNCFEFQSTSFFHMRVWRVHQTSLNVFSSTISCIWSGSEDTWTDLTLSADISSKTNNCGWKYINVCEVLNRVQSVHVSSHTSCTSLATHSESQKQLYIEQVIWSYSATQQCCQSAAQCCKWTGKISLCIVICPIYVFPNRIWIQKNV